MDGEVIEATLPDEAFGSLLLVEQAEGLDDCLLSYVPNRLDPQRKGTLYLANPGAADLDLEVKTGIPDQSDSPSPGGNAPGDSTRAGTDDDTAPISVTVPGGGVAALEVAPGDDALGGLFQAVVRHGATERTLQRRFFPLFDRRDFEARCEDSETHGVRALRIGPSDTTRHEVFPLHLHSGETYHYRIEYFRTGGESELSLALVNYHLLDESQDRHAIPFPAEDEWAVAEGSFTVPERAFSAALYLYNWRSTRTLWIRDIRIEGAE